MIIAILHDGGVVETRDEQITGGPLPSNWLVPCPVTVDDDAFWTHDGTAMFRRPQEEIDAIVAARKAAEEAEIEAKKAMVPFLQQMETRYCHFLKGEWTDVLHQYGLIPPEFQITVDNTTRDTNMGLMFWLEGNQKPEYSPMYAKFKGLEEGITTMQKLIQIPVGLAYCKEYAI